MANEFFAVLMFEGTAEQAMALYVSIFKDARILEVQRFGAEGPGAEGSIKRAELLLGNYKVVCFDSPVKHRFTFTPSVSLFVECDSIAELDQIHGQLSAGGAVLMPPGQYGFSTKFTWFNDRFGVSWQLNVV